MKSGLNLLNRCRCSLLHAAFGCLYRVEIHATALYWAAVHLDQLSLNSTLGHEYLLLCSSYVTLPSLLLLPPVHALIASA